jgi:type I restriction enzyme R subunit
MASETTYQQTPDPKPSAVKEQDIEESFIQKLRDLKYTDRPDIHDRASLEANFRQKFENLNRCKLTDAEFARLLLDLVTDDLFKNSVRLREKNDFTRDDGTPLSYTLVNIRDWCKNDYEVVHQLRINTDYSHHRYDVIRLINGVSVAQVELKTVGMNPRRAMADCRLQSRQGQRLYPHAPLRRQALHPSKCTNFYYFANNDPGTSTLLPMSSSSRSINCRQGQRPCHPPRSRMNHFPANL